MRTAHSKELEDIYDSHTQDYHREALDRYLTKDDTQYLAKGENNPLAVASYTQLDNIFKETHRSRYYVHHWATDVDRLRYAYLTQALPLQRQLATLTLLERAIFPASSQEYFDIKNKDIQLRIARFLMADDLGKEKMMKEFGWSWGKVKTLCEVYDRMPSFQTEILLRVKQVEAKDPRKRG